VDIVTYIYLRDHARRGFISHYPASRVISGQMNMHRILERRVHTSYAGDAEKRDALLALFRQEFQERILHVTDLFVEGRENELREQEASYQQATDNAPAAIFTVDHECG